MTYEGRSWQWEELDPLTQCVVAGFSERIGNEAEGDLPGRAFINAATASFRNVTEEDVSRGSMSGIRNLLIAELSAANKADVTAAFQKIGKLAGGGQAVAELAAWASETVTASLAFHAIPAIRVLSELAIHDGYKR